MFIFVGESIIGCLDCRDIGLVTLDQGGGHRGGRILEEDRVNIIYGGGLWGTGCRQVHRVGAFTAGNRFESCRTAAEP